MKIEIQLDAFEGPLDLLLHLITRDEIDIYDIPIVSITTQYMTIIENSDLNLDRTSEFLVMAATLLEIKSKMLLPNHDREALQFEMEDSDPREELVRRLVNYKRYKDAAQRLQAFEGTLDEIVFKEQEELSNYISAQGVDDSLSLDQALLTEALSRVVLKMKRFDEQRADFFGKIRRDHFTVEEKIEQIERMTNEANVCFDDLLSETRIKEEVVVTFLALLELLKLGRIRISQAGLFEPIYIERATEETKYAN
ncbi:segregation/condensation protein A [Fusibacter paucivorans]|uniref:Segregation and condensation protein A n=1 Tax=Fusibacter paucivorans TaxID=76009 RepID=A0ABS5PQN2_9FIRM|nr:segregation/condensation protein A [Fusibacter paucivorans]MBS7526686.1 segregation/condensation protein A [Fusibacter paucivorans]